LSDVHLSHVKLIDALNDIGGFAVPAHAGRPSIGMAAYVDDNLVEIEKIVAIEVLNGGSNNEENARAQLIANKYNFKTVGGSDAHFVSSIGKCVTLFKSEIKNEEDLVRALKNDNYSAYEEQSK
jgi:PHP family Zn ribbon phosphoesterase